jgi:hypothetical protein
MIIDTKIGKLFLKSIKAEAELEHAKHVSSGGLSASTLYDPLQWQVLKYLGYDKVEFSDYAYGLFRRGKKIEEDFIANLPRSLVWSTQVPLSYKNVVGIADTIMDSKELGLKVGQIPVEVKSVTRANFKRIFGRHKTEVRKNHAIQAALYALALGAKHFGLLYIVADDYESRLVVLETKDYQKEIDDIITAYNTCIKLRLLPLFEPRIDWQANPKFNKFPQFSDLKLKELNELGNKLFKEKEEKNKATAKSITKKLKIKKP